MDSKKLKTIISAEEEHLSSKSIKKLKKVQQKKSETNIKMDLFAGTEISASTGAETDIKTGTVIDNPSNTYNLNQFPINVEIANTIAKKKGKSKKPRKHEYDTQNISVKSSFNKFDALQKRSLIHSPPDEQQTNCRQCNKPVYKMEEIIVQFKSDKGIYHKYCLRCKDCAKQLKFDNYQSHEGHLYCNVHFKLLFAPKVVLQACEPKPRKAELIIRESQPTELPADVVRASDKPDLGLDELHQLNVRSRFQVFENVEQKNQEEEQFRKQQRPLIKRNTSILTKYCINSAENKNEFKPRNNNINESDDEEDEEKNEDADLVRSKKCTQKERPIGLGDAMNDIKIRFEKGHIQSKEERREERKQEIQSIRSRLFMGKQAKIKEMYQQAVAESEQAITSVGKKPDVDIGVAARSIKDRFENGEMFFDKTYDPQTLNSNANFFGLSEDADVFESAISKKSRSIFMELDANMTTNTNVKHELRRNRSDTLSKSVSPNQFSQENGDIDVVKCDAKPEDVKIETAEISQKFKFFETYRPNDAKKRQFRITPPREGVVKMPTPDSDSEQLGSQDQKSSFHDNVLQKAQTTSTMLNKFREMELGTCKGFELKGPRPLKCFTPPPEDGHSYYDKSNSEEDDEESDDDESDVDKETLDVNLNTDEALKEAQNAARAKQLRAKFEKWQVNEIKRELNEGYVDIYSQQVSDDSTIESAKAIRERFENMTSFESKSPSGPRHQVNRFV